MGSVALAFFVAQGAGTGTAPVTGTIQGPGASALAVNVGTAANADGTNGVATPAPTYGGAAVPIDFSIDNVVNASAVQIPSVSVTVQVDSVHAAAGCLASWFTVAPGQLFTAGGGGISLPYLISQGSVGTGINDFTNGQSTAWTVSFPTDATDNQTSCEGAQLTITVNVP